MYFISPTKGKLNFNDMMADIAEYITGLPTSSYKVIIGSDSQVKSETCFITAVVVHRLGKGARYYYRKRIQRKIKSLRQKIFYETALSLEVGSRIANYLAENGLDDLEVEIHIDVGKQGETRVETLFRTYTKKGTGDTVNGDQETGALFCYRYFVWRPEKEPGE
ncbi:MAG: ribonuclease H-like YkuK family protein, partial [Bacillota bacterium]